MAQRRLKIINIRKLCLLWSLCLKAFVGVEKRAATTFAVWDELVKDLRGASKEG